MSEKSFAIKEGANPPPRAGRTPFQDTGNSTNPLFIRHFEASALGVSRQLAAEHDANVSLRNGETTGNEFPSRSRRLTTIIGTFLYVAWIAAVIIMAALLAPPCSPQDITGTNHVRPAICGPQASNNTKLDLGARR